MTKLRNQSTEQYARSFVTASLAIVAVFGVLLLRLAYIQIWKGETFRNLSENNRIRVMEIHAPRGKILDARGQNLVDNRPCFDVAAIPEEIRDYGDLAARLGPLSPLETGKLRERLDEIKRGVPFRSYTLWKDATWEAMAYLEANRLRTPGVVIQVNQARDYLYGNLLAHVLGYMGEINRKELEARAEAGYRIGDLIGKVGIEKTWEEHLRGKKGGVQVEVDARGRQISVLRRKEPVPGKNVVLCLRRDIQEEARRAFGDQPGVALAMDPRDGSLLCYVNLPSYDPNSFVGGIPSAEWEALRSDPLHPLTNRAIQGLYPPGSVFKVVVAVAALEEGVVAPEEKIFCGGSYQLGRRSFRCWKRHGHGWVDLHRALVESCDVYFYQIGQRLGIKRLQDYAERFGLGRTSGIRLRGERAGLVPSPAWKRRRFDQPWYEGETLLVAIGQGALLVTPLQQLGIMAAVAADGTLWRPRLVDRVEYPEGRVHAVNPVESRGSLPASPQTLDLVQNALRDVVHGAHGTGQRARVPFAEVAGKTGTAQVIRQEHPGALEDTPWEQRDHAWFACYAPVFAPEIAVAVLVEHGGHGGVAAAPIARRILEVYFGSGGDGNDDARSLARLASE